MPRDSKGNLFGIGSKVDTPGGVKVVRGFAVSQHKADMDTIITVAQAAGFNAYHWTDIENTNPNEKGHEDSSDLCPQDRRAMQEGIESALAMAEIENQGAKVVWCD